MSMSDEQLDATIENNLRLAEKTVDLAHKGLLIQEAQVKAMLALAAAIEHLAKTQEPQVIIQQQIPKVPKGKRK